MVIGERPLSTLHSPRNDGAVDRYDEKRAIQRSAVDRSTRCRKKIPKLICIWQQISGPRHQIPWLRNNTAFATYPTLTEYDPYLLWDIEPKQRISVALRPHHFRFPFYPISADRRSGDLDPIFYCSVIEFVKCVCSLARAQKMTNGL